MDRLRRSTRANRHRTRFSRRSILRHLGRSVAAVALAPALSNPGSSAAQQNTSIAGQDSPFPPEQQLALEAILEQRLAETRTPGAVVGVWIPGRGTWIHADGIGDLATAAPVTKEDKFRIASVTKTFVATVVLQLVDEGRLQLEDHLEQYVPGIPNGERITIRQVLGMTAGIFNFVEDHTFEAEYSRDPLMSFSPQQVIDIVQRHPPDFAPGERLQYSDTNYILLGMIIEQLTAQSAGEAIAERIIEPLGLAATSFPTTPDIPVPYAHGYGSDASGAGLRDVTRSNPDVPWTAGAMISDLADLRIWAKALAGGALLSPAVQGERLRWTPFPPPQVYDVFYGLGIMKLNGFVGHNGAIFGYSTWLAHEPEADATIVVLANRAETTTEVATPIFLDIAKLLFPDRFPD